MPLAEGEKKKCSFCGERRAEEGKSLCIECLENMKNQMRTLGNLEVKTTEQKRMEEISGFKQKEKSLRKITVICTECGHEFKTKEGFSAESVSHGTCPECAKNFREKEMEEFRKKFEKE